MLPRSKCSIGLQRSQIHYLGCLQRYVYHVFCRRVEVRNLTPPVFSNKYVLYSMEMRIAFDLSYGMTGDIRSLAPSLFLNSQIVHYCKSWLDSSNVFVCEV